MRNAFILTVTFLLTLSAGALATADESIPFSERNAIKYVTAYINGIPIELVFDTGANRVVLNSEGLARIGLQEFDDTRRHQAYTAGGVTEGYMIRLDSIRVGNIKRDGYDIAYVPSSTRNLLGASFFEGYSYFVDEDYKVIRLVPKGSYFFDSPEQSSVEQSGTGPGLIEVEIDGEKYIYEDGKLIRKQNIPR